MNFIEFVFVRVVYHNPKTVYILDLSQFMSIKIPVEIQQGTQEQSPPDFGDPFPAIDIRGFTI
jgi:hypothetical protein